MIKTQTPPATMLHELTEPLPKVMQQFYGFLERKPRLNLWHQRLVALDTKMCIQANLLSHRGLIGQFFKLVSRLGDGWIWGASIMLMAVLLIVKGMAYQQVAMTTVVILLTSLTGYLIYKFLKVHTVRPRPYQVHQAIILKERPLDVFSFPSGHTLQAVLLTVLIGSQMPVMLWVLVPFTLLVALSRLVLGLHYPTDVLVGAGIGITLAKIGSYPLEFLQSF